MRRALSTVLGAVVLTAVAAPVAPAAVAPATAASVVRAATPVAPAAGAATPTGWTSPTVLQPGVSPVLSFSPTGAAALGSEVFAHGHAHLSYVDLAGARGVFAAHPYELTAPSAGAGSESLAGLVLSSTGNLAALFADAKGAAPILARVSPPPPKGFGSVQRLINVGRADRDQAVPDTLAILPTSRGEIVGAGTDDAGALSTTTLAAHATRFVTRRGPAGLSASDADALASDPAGDTFLAGDGASGCSTVAFRAPRGHFTQTYRTGNCTSATPNVFDAITATRGARAALLSEDVSEAGTVPTRLLIQVGRAGHFGTATQLGGALGGPVGLASDADGELTAEWTGCQTGALSDGHLSLNHCAILATTGSVTHGLGPHAVTGTTLARATAGTTLSALTADRAVGVSRCQAHGCALSAVTAKPGGGFRAAHTLGRASAKLIAFTSDTHGDLLAVWRDPRGRLLAATGSAASGRWSAAHLLSAQPVAPSQVSAASGPRGRAMVAWSAGGRVRVASVRP